MVDKVETAIVSMWGKTVGAVAWLQDRGYAVFEYAPDFLNYGLDISPIHMSLEDAVRGDGVFSFPALGRGTFSGLPGLLADALPDKFGNSIIDAWLALQGREAGSFSPIERLCYTGCRGMGALEFQPAFADRLATSVPVNVTELVGLAQQVIQHRKGLDVSLGKFELENAEALMDILRVGTSAGGARPKAVIAINEDGHVISGQTTVPKGYDYWILKFDGVSDIELGDSDGLGRVEYAYHLMARAAGIAMADCQLLEENGRGHFMTKRFDRLDGDKLHMQSLCGMAHFEFNDVGIHSYEQVFSTMRKLRLSKAEALQQYRRMLFNIIARNQDDHTKNIAFLMDKAGKWALSPAFDVTYSHNPAGRWTNKHQMSAAGKRDGFTRADLIGIGESISLPKPESVMDEIMHVVSQWTAFATEAGVSGFNMEQIGNNHRLMLR